jgi:hypothetical protein
VRGVIGLQDLVGGHQDAQVAVDRLRQLLASDVETAPREVAFVMGELAQGYAEEAAELRAAFPATHRRVTGKRWRKLHRVLGAHALHASPRANRPRS